MSDERSAFSRWNVITEIERLHVHPFATPADRESATRAVVEGALSSERTVQLTATGLEASLDEAPDPTVRRSNGENMLTTLAERIRCAPLAWQ